MKRLVVCCDGTWQALKSPYPTNVVKIAQAVRSFSRDGQHQIVFYLEGLGTEGQTGKVLGGFLEMGIDKTIEDAYRFLCLNYVPGDEIYLFGFSRGAYTVRSLVGLIYCSGLLWRTNIRLAPQAYAFYRDHSVTPQHPEVAHFRRTHGVRVPITLLGCWDTVGALGVPRQIGVMKFDDKLNDRYQFRTMSLSPLVQHALHAVAIDEQREVFDITPMTQRPNARGQVLRQMWFPGNHACVGGGNAEKRGLSDGALLWMMESMDDLGLGLDLDIASIPDGVQPDHTIDFDNTLTGIYRLTGAKSREVADDFEHLHTSVKRRWRDRTDYRPEKLATKHAVALDTWQEQESERLKLFLNASRAS